MIYIWHLISPDLALLCRRPRLPGAAVEPVGRGVVQGGPELKLLVGVGMSMCVTE